MRMPGDFTDATARRRVRSISGAPLALSVLALSGISVLTGCQSNASSGDEASMEQRSTTTVVANTSSASDDRAAMVQEIEGRYVVGPIAASKAGYRVDWQYDTGHSDVKMVTVADDSVFALTNGNFLTRVSREEGQHYWDLPVAQVADEIYSITYVPEDGRVFVMTGAELHELESATGAIQGKHRLQQIANTTSAQWGDSLLYGSRNGQLVWFSHRIAFQHSAYQVAHTMTVAPALHAGMIAAVGNDGELMLISASNARRYWSRKLIEEVVSSPVVTNDAVYVAGLDQYVQAFDVTNGLRIWADLAEAPLVDAPVVIGDRLYQAIPGHGLSCYEALPYDMPGGMKHWHAEGVAGTVVTTRGNRLYVWDDDSRVMSIVDSARGDLIESFHWPKVESLQATSMNRGELFVTDNDGNVLRMKPNA